MYRKNAFTLVELLIVVGIIALLIALIMPSLTRARDLAKKTVCAAQINSYGRAIMLFVTDTGSYPAMGTGPRGGWPKFYGVLEGMRVEPPLKLASGPPGDRIVWWDYSPWELDEVYDKAFCPGMDVIRIIGASDRALAIGLSPAWKPSLHRAAAGYQWNVNLRKAGTPTLYFSSGRWPIAPWNPAGTNWGEWDNTIWIDFILNLAAPGDYVCQAVKPDEIEQPAYVAEAWDSWDHDSVPMWNWADSQYSGMWRWENMVPGWTVGPQSENCNGWALLNGARHPSGPNVLYADGHVAADVMKEVPTNQLSSPPGSATWQDAKLVSWENFDEDFGTMGHIVPERSFTTNPK